jgi:hypothetical protein
MKTTRQLLRLTVTAAICAMAGATYAAPDTPAQVKDIVLNRINSAPVVTNSATPAVPAVNAVSSIHANGDAMVVRVLKELGNGGLKPHPTNTLFKTGDKFRVKMLASRDGKVALYNTKPTGELVIEPLWRGDVTRGLEIISPSMRLEGTKGTDQLHIVLEPAVPEPIGLVTWLGNWLGSSSKDIRLDVQNTSTETYLLGIGGKGLVTTLRITHR